MQTRLGCIPAFPKPWLVDANRELQHAFAGDDGWFAVRRQDHAGSRGCSRSRSHGSALATSHKRADTRSDTGRQRDLGSVLTFGRVGLNQERLRRNFQILSRQ